MDNYRIAVFGLGHIGLPTAALFARAGFDVTGVDISTETVEKVNIGKSPVPEPGLDELVAEVVGKGKLRATVDGVSAAEESNVMVVVVPTPVNSDNTSDLSAVISATETISKGLKKGDLVIIESTVPPGACENVVLPILEKTGLRASGDFGLAYTPERALPNNTLHEMQNNARVIGGIDGKSAEMAAQLYGKVTRGEVIVVDDIITAEMVKLMENTYRDTNIALANELAVICESLGIDAIKAIEAANHHPRVNLHTPGPGVGGHCLSIDPYFIVEMAEKHGVPARLIRTAREVNESMPFHVLDIIRDALESAGRDLAGSRVGVLGVAYKGDVADARKTPTRPLVAALISEGAEVVVNDPHVDPVLIKKMGVEPVPLEEALESDCVVLMTDHSEYLEITPEMIVGGIFICTRPVLDPEKFREHGIIFRGVGRP
ncbi:nucleotide sugar dehydrogenase [Methanothermobacter marburgensis]|uniref:UDP-N-acetyl-D-mannosamine dehydrogenase n=1 Tax=Methanothermobacter marburgensis (strain ATCC BAA-927 / DSM 2133 / JCM 14651 / NBRC 100331 / OCM 82 / Marburg) TaxID=79929 RepID=D9PX74_METTM|nr:predicted UDP-N-acetyl-D-mannosaminuronate dehydrogenase [Methanothermobacter marburgensis str. Marburg]WBF10725.1 nucleotide sugar dehydrogenase [Methanothermobacter marburgensis]